MNTIDKNRPLKCFFSLLNKQVHFRRVVLSDAHVTLQGMCAVDLHYGQSVK